MSKHRDDKKHSKKSSKKSKKHTDRDHRKHDLPKGVDPINEEDFFLKATEFRVWLQQKRDLYLDDLTNEKATSLFKSKFVKRWNEGKLDKMYYRGIPDDVIEATKRTRHKWNFVSKLSEKEQFELATTKDSVGVATKKTSTFSHENPKQMNFDDEKDHHDSTRRNHDEEDDRRVHRAERKRYHRDKEEILEELIPKETGRDAIIQKRREKSDKLHGSAKAREDTKDGLDLGEDFLLGGSDDIKERLEGRKRARQQKEQEQQEKIFTAEANEASRMKKFLQEMGINPGQDRIVIAPRK